MKLGRTFFSLYFLIVLFFLLFSWLLDEAWSSYIEQDVESYTGYKTMLAAVGDYLQNHPEEQWDTILAGASKRYELALSLTTITEIDDKHFLEHGKIAQGKTHIYYKKDRVVLHHRLDNSDKLLVLGPAKMPTRPRIEAFMRVIAYAILGLIIFVWLWPMSKDLDQLKKTAVSFGEGHFDSQAPEAKSSIMEPMISSFNMMAGRIKRLIEAHKELTNAVAHELRTPLARSKFALQMFSTVKDEEKKQRYVKQIESDISELEELINEMLLYASFDSDTPELKFTQQNINQLITSELKRFEHFDGQINFIAKQGSIIAECDVHFIERVLQNYISNAVKYGNDKIKISVTAENQRCLITVEDNGEGVSDKFKNTVFDAFSRGDNSRNKETGGFGLGLAIVGRISEWHNGEVSVDDSDLGGAKFTFSWPLQRL